MSTEDRDGGAVLGRRTFLGHAGAIGAAALLPSTYLNHAAAADPAGQLRIRIGTDITLLDPARLFAIENQSVAANIYNGLVKYDAATNKIVPDLALSWEVGAGGQAYTFHLRDGVEFHKNYGAFTAEDVKFSFDRVLDPATNSPYKSQIDGIINSVEIPDRMTVRFNLKKPNAEFLHKVAAFNQGWIVSRRAVTELGERFNVNPIGTGPFVFEKWTPGSEVRLSANPKYFEGASKFPVLIFRLISDETAAAIALEKREIDIFFALQQPALIDRLKHTKGVTVLNRVANSALNLVINTTIEPLNDVRVRQAIAFGINRKGIIDGFFRGTKFEATSVLTSAFQEYTADVPRYPYDPARARELLKQAGVSAMKFEIAAPGLAPYDKMVVPIANDLNQIGIETKVRVLERAAYNQARSSGNVHSCITGVVGPADPSAPLLALYSSRSFPPGLNTSRYSGIDAMLASAAEELDPAKRKAVYKTILQKTMTDVPLLPLFADQLFMAYSDSVTGLVQNSMFTVQAYGVSPSKA